MRVDRLTNPLQEALADAQSIAVGKDHSTIEPSHVLIALLEQRNGTTRQLLLPLGVDMHRLTSGLNKTLEELPVIQHPTGEIQISSGMGKVFNLADKQSQKRGDQFISCEVMLLALFQDTGAVGKLLQESGVHQQQLGQAIANMRGGNAIHSADSEAERQALEKYTIDLTERAKQGKLDPVIGRDDEIRR
ncbi:MAG: type VI secretion system ATPase TssH, partial [Pseudomonadales bacterium]|nr:type VI secretion system ATPase TssH [Pseudomonadales bacterium]